MSDHGSRSERTKLKQSDSTPVVARGMKRLKHSSSAGRAAHFTVSFGEMQDSVMKGEHTRKGRQGGGSRGRDTRILMADSCQYMAATSIIV